MSWEVTRTRQSRKMSRLASERGSILVLVLLLMTVLVTMTISGLRQARVEKSGAQIMEQRMQAMSLAQSGVRLAEFALLSDLRRDMEKERVDHFGEDWGGFLLEGSRDLPRMDTGELQGEIMDEQGKFPINALLAEGGGWHYEYRQVFHNLLIGYFALSQEEAETVLQSLKDWMDPDEEPSGLRGAEAEYYEQGSLPWRPRNEPLRSVAELRYIRGISAKLYKGAGDALGLKDLVTVHSDGGININTAAKPLLAALIIQEEASISRGEAQSFAGRMVSHRENRMHWDSLSDPQWWTKVAGALSVDMHPVIGTTSSVFSVQVKAWAGSVYSQSYAVLERRSGAEERKSPRVKRLLYEAR